MLKFLQVVSEELHMTEKQTDGWTDAQNHFQYSPPAGLGGEYLFYRYTMSFLSLTAIAIH